MDMNRNEFEQRTHEVLEESTARLDGRTRSRLTQARHAALEAGAKNAGPRWFGWRTLAPAGAVAAAAVVAVLMWPLGRVADPAPLDDIELLADGDAPDFTVVAEDLEFYEWAAGEVET
jgi:hypothetical protein